MSRSRGMWSLAAAAVIGFFATPPSYSATGAHYGPFCLFFHG